MQHLDPILFLGIGLPKSYIQIVDPGLNLVLLVWVQIWDPRKLDPVTLGNLGRTQHRISEFSLAVE